MSCSCKNITSGISDHRNSISILTTRIFDNIRFDLDRSPLIIDTDIVPSAITALYVGGTGTVVPDSGVTVTPHINDNYADVSGTISLPATVTYIYEGTRQTSSARLSVPINARMNIPEDSVWPFDITVHYSFFADNLKEEATNTYSSLVDGVVIVYITACVPVSLNNYSSIQYNDINQRTIINENNFTSSSFYPRSGERVTVCKN